MEHTCGKSISNCCTCITWRRNINHLECQKLPTDIFVVVCKFVCLFVCFCFVLFSLVLFVSLFSLFLFLFVCFSFGGVMRFFVCFTRVKDHRKYNEISDTWFCNQTSLMHSKIEIVCWFFGGDFIFFWNFLEHKTCKVFFFFFFFFFFVCLFFVFVLFLFLFCLVFFLARLKFNKSSRNWVCSGHLQWLFIVSILQGLHQ